VRIAKHKSSGREVAVKCVFKKVSVVKKFLRFVSLSILPFVQSLGKQAVRSLSQEITVLQALRGKLLLVLCM
jgi:hypothetical protein